MTSGMDGLDPVALARAEAAVSNLAERYLAWAEADLARLEQCLADLLAASAAERRPGLGRLFAIAHDMKGQGATFDYPLVSHLGNRLCRLAEACSGEAEDDLLPLADLVRGLGVVLRGRLTGDGGEDGRRLLAGLGLAP